MTLLLFSFSSRSSEVDRVNFIEHTEAYKGDSILKSIQEPYQVHLENNTQFKPLGMDPQRNVRAHFVKPAPEATVHHEQVCGCGPVEWDLVGVVQWSGIKWVWSSGVGSSECGPVVWY